MQNLRQTKGNKCCCDNGRVLDSWLRQQQRTLQQRLQAKSASTASTGSSDRQSKAMAGIWTQHLHVESGHTYFFNAKTGVSSWVHPAVQAAQAFETPQGAEAQQLPSATAGTTNTNTANESTSTSSDAERCVPSTGLACSLLAISAILSCTQSFFSRRLKSQIAARLARRKGGVASTTVRKLGGKKRFRGISPGGTASPGPGSGPGSRSTGDLQAAYKHAVEKLAEAAPDAAKGSDGRGLVK